MKERLQKIISSSGFASRRTGEELIRSGRVTVNGSVAALGDSADPDTDTICVDGLKLNIKTGRTYIMLNKPKGYVTTLHDEKGRPCVSELVKDAGLRLFPIGRLDMYSEGLLLMTDDGELANRLMHPSHRVSKTYHVWTDRPCSPESLRTMRSRLDIDGYIIEPADVEIIKQNTDYSQLSVTIHEGRNRQVRKMCELSGMRVKKLVRVSEGGLSLGKLRPGEWRYLTDAEMQVLSEKES